MHSLHKSALTAPSSGNSGITSLPLSSPAGNPLCSAAGTTCELPRQSCAPVKNQLHCEKSRSWNCSLPLNWCENSGHLPEFGDVPHSFRLAGRCK